VYLLLRLSALIGDEPVRIGDEDNAAAIPNPPFSLVSCVCVCEVRRKSKSK